MVVQLEQRLFTVAEVERMAAAGILDEDDRLELIEGVLVRMRPMGPRHASYIARLTTLFGRTDWPGTLLWIQNPIQLSLYSAPEPDLAVVRAGDDFYGSQLPGPADVLLVIEVSDSSLATDRGVKLRLYAEGLIPEVWIIDVFGARIEQYSEPNGQTYRTVRRYGRGERIACVGNPALRFATDAILG